MATDTLINDIGLWARRAVAISTATEIDVWTAFEARDRVRQALDAGATLDQHHDALLATADDLWDEHQAQVLPLLELGTYLAACPEEHYARHYKDTPR